MPKRYILLKKIKVFILLSVDTKVHLFVPSWNPTTRTLNKYLKVIFKLNERGFQTYEKRQIKTDN